MYRSQVDALPQELAFEFDPLRPYHAHDNSGLKWPEYPYKQVMIDKLCSRFTNPKLGQEAAAGALLIARGDIERAVFEVEQNFDHDHEADHNSYGNAGWITLSDRFLKEREAFGKAKRDFLKSERLRVANMLQSIEHQKIAEEERIAYEAWRDRQIIKWFDNGNKYEGEGINQNDVLIPHGHGTLWVPHKDSLTGSRLSDLRRVPRYVGHWMDGFMHGQGTYRWQCGDSWEGNFCRDELQGKGIYTFASVTSEESPTGRGFPKEQRVRYYDASQHVCWGDELVRGCRLRLFENRLYGDPLVSVVRRHNVDLEEETEYVIVRYDTTRDQYLVRRGESECTRWISLSNVNFRVVPSRPITRFEHEEEN